jgi:hypothetical protein
MAALAKAAFQAKISQTHDNEIINLAVIVIRGNTSYKRVP